MQPAIPSRSRVPAGNTATCWLKLIALVFMFIDHAGKIFFPAVPEMRILGRIAFPPEGERPIGGPEKCDAARRDGLDCAACFMVRKEGRNAGND